MTTAGLLLLLIVCYLGVLLRAQHLVDQLAAELQRVQACHWNRGQAPTAGWYWLASPSHEPPVIIRLQAGHLLPPDAAAWGPLPVPTFPLDPAE